MKSVMALSMIVGFMLAEPPEHNARTFWDSLFEPATIAAFGALIVTLWTNYRAWKIADAVKAVDQKADAIENKTDANKDSLQEVHSLVDGRTTKLDAKIEAMQAENERLRSTLTQTVQAGATRQTVQETVKVAVTDAVKVAVADAKAEVPPTAPPARAPAAPQVPPPGTH